MTLIVLNSTIASLSGNVVFRVMAYVLILSLSLSFHEAAHAFTAYKMGDDTAALQGRLTLNPLAHLDPVGSLVFIISSLGGRGIGWAKPVPINPARFDHKYSMKKGLMLSSLAGPVSNLVLAFVSVVLFYVLDTAFLLLRVDNIVTDVLMLLISWLYSANIMLAVFNLLPVPPLDGFKIFGAALPNSIYYKVMSYERYIGMIFLFLVLFGGSFLGTIIGLIATPFDFVIIEPVQWLFLTLQRALGLIA